MKGFDFPEFKGLGVVSFPAKFEEKNGSVYILFVFKILKKELVVTSRINNNLPSVDALGNNISYPADAWEGSYMGFRKIGPNRFPLDPWKNEYQMDVSVKPYRVRSLGPDEDDDNWQEYNPSTGNGDIVYQFQ